MRIELYSPEHREAVVELSLRAWAPVFASLENAMDSDVYRLFFPDWRVAQQKAVQDACSSKNTKAWVALESEQVTGFVVIRFHHESAMGEIHMIAVDPSFQRRGIAAALTEHALDAMRASGMSIAMVETGGDPGHAPARSAYEKAGFRLFPVARYFKRL